MGNSQSKDRYSVAGHFKPEDIANYYGDKFYLQGTDFWKKQDKTITRMLNGFTYIHEKDINFSRTILERQINVYHLGKNRCAEFGAGIGRVTKNLLANYFDEIDLIDPVKEFLDYADNDFGDRVKLHLHPIGAQNWKADEDYDCFWFQWTLMYLTNNDCVSLLKDCKFNLKLNGKIFVKENGYPNGANKSLAYWNPQDHSFIRSHESYLEIFNKAGLMIIEDLIEPDWYDDLPPLYTFVLC